MRRLLVVTLVVAFVLGAVGSAMAATWNFKGLLSTDPTLGGYQQNAFNPGQPKVSGFVVDSASGKAYISTNVGRDSGKITVININTGAIIGSATTVNAASQIVIGPDGNPYAVLNQEHSTSNNLTPSSSVVRIDDLGGGAYQATKIFAPEDVNSLWANKPIVGIGTDANGVYWTLGSDCSKYNTGYKYNTATGTWALATSGNTGWSEPLKMYGNATPVGTDANGATVLALATGGGNWRVDTLHLDGTTNRDMPIGWSGTPSSQATVSIYDAARNNYWTMTSGLTGSALIANVDGVDGGSWLGSGAVVGHLSHVGINGNWNQDTNGMFGSAITIDPLTGDALYAVGYSATSTQAGALTNRGHVLRSSIGMALTDEGVPDAAGQVVSLTSYNGATYAVTLDTLGNYKLYTTAAVPEPSSLLALASGMVGMAGFAIRRKRS